MKEYRSIKRTFSDCSLRVMLPKITIVEPYVNVNFSVIFNNQKAFFKYVVKECAIVDKQGNTAIVQLKDQTNFEGNAKITLSIDSGSVSKSAFEMTITILTIDGDHVDITYLYEKYREPVLKTVGIADMEENEKDFCIKAFDIESKVFVPVTPTAKPAPKVPTSNYVLDKYVSAMSSELSFLKHNGGKKHKVTDGRLLTPKSNEYCYSFELESELYLSDDAPVSVLLGLETINGTVIVCDGFQIIVSLERSIGDTVSSAQISVEPWKLLEKLRDNVKQITPSDTIAWKLYHQGPTLADKTSDVATIGRGQELAIQHALDEDITVVWGPPGTGKTYTMAQMTERFVSMGKTVLIVSHSNISVDNVVKQISNQFSQNHLASILPQGKVLRYGYVRDEELRKNDNCVAFNFALCCHPEIKKQYETFSEESKKLKIEYQFRKDPEKAIRIKEIEKLLKKIRATLKTESQELTAKAQVVATTISKLYMDKLFEYKKYDVVMFDEVSMAYVPQLLCAATFAREKFICVGDFRQLPPIVQSQSAKEVLERDIFSFLNINRYGAIYNHPWLVMLNEQRRMHPHISKFSNQLIYRGLLKNHSSVEAKWDSVVACDPLAGTAMSLIDLYGLFCAASKNADNSRFNILSALFAFAIALKNEKSQEKLQFKAEEKVGIITPYAAQTRLVRAIIQDYRQKDSTAISCATVHQFQGSERNAIIFDAVESYPFSKPGWLVSKNDNGSVMRLINVALTRARGKFITLANTRFWNNKFGDTQNTYFKLLKHIETNNTVVGIKDDQSIEFMKTLDFGKNIKPYFNAADSFEQLLKDINSAKQKIVITLPTNKLNSQYESLIMKILAERSRAGISVLGKAKNMDGLSETWKNLVFQSKDAAFPLIAIDDRVVWYGFPITELFFVDKSSKFLCPKTPIFRIAGKYTNEMIGSLCDLDHRLDENDNRIKLMEKSNCSAGAGLAEFIKEKELCKNCGAPMQLTKGHSGKNILVCSSCKNYDLLSKYTVNEYLSKSKAKCPICRGDLYAGVSAYGLYVKCNDGHFIKLSEI